MRITTTLNWNCGTSKNPRSGFWKSPVVARVEQRCIQIGTIVARVEQRCIQSGTIVSGVEQRCSQSGTRVKPGETLLPDAHFDAMFLEQTGGDTVAVNQRTVKISIPDFSASTRRAV